VVIAIIAILATMATPAIMRALQKAKIVRVSAICKGFETAVDGFENEYNYLPYGSADYPTTEDELSDNHNDVLIACLAGVNEDLNFKGNKYLELDEPSGSSDATYKDGMHVDRAGGTAALYDPWGDRYHIVLDYIQDPDDGIEHPYDTSERLRRKVIIFSYGPDGQVATDSIRDSKNKDNPSNF